MLQHCWFSWSQLSFIQLNHILQKKTSCFILDMLVQLLHAPVVLHDFFANQLIPDTERTETLASTKPISDIHSRRWCIRSILSRLKRFSKPH
jgi:hypothetical protein